MQLSNDLLRQAKEAGVKVYLGRSELKKSDLSDKSIEILLEAEDHVRREWQLDVDLGQTPTIGASIYLYGFGGQTLLMVRGPSDLVFSRGTKSDVTEALKQALGEDKVAAYVRYAESVVVGLTETPKVTMDELRYKLQSAEDEGQLKEALKEIKGLTEGMKADAVMLQYQAVNGEAVLAMTQIKTQEDGSRDLGSTTLWLVMDPSSVKGDIFNNITRAFSLHKKENGNDAKRKEEEDTQSPHQGATH